MSLSVICEMAAVLCGYRYDLVDVTRQSLQVLGAWFYTEVIQAYHDNDLIALR